MKHKCDDCFYKSDWIDLVETFPICERFWDTGLNKARDECAKPGPCEMYLTHEKAREIIKKYHEIVDHE